MRSLGEWHSDKELDDQDEGQNSAAARWGPSPGQPEEIRRGKQRLAHLTQCCLQTRMEGRVVASWI